MEDCGSKGSDRCEEGGADVIPDIHLPLLGQMDAARSLRRRQRGMDDELDTENPMSLDLLTSFEQQTIEEIVVTEPQQPRSNHNNSEWWSQTEGINPSVLNAMFAFKQREMELRFERDMYNRKLDIEAQTQPNHPINLRVWRDGMILTEA